MGQPEQRSYPRPALLIPLVCNLYRNLEIPLENHGDIGHNSHIAVRRQNDFIGEGFTMKKQIKALFMALCLSTAAAGISISPAFVMESEAHSGRTDSNGGHHDYKNKSGLGDYHYHHGYGPHLHPNGVCPYTSGTGSSSGSVQNSPVGGGSSSGTASSNKWFCDDYKGCCSYIFDSSYYAEKYPELAETFGYDSDKLYSHFVSNGMSEGRQGCSTFNVQVYKDNNPDLSAVYGDDLPCYYEHYMLTGHSEGRTAY